jgi:hypothetical protein
VPVDLTSQRRLECLAALRRLESVDRSVLEQGGLLIGREGRLSVFYAPFDSVNEDARLVLLGLTPGWQQMQIALNTYRSSRGQGASDAEAQRAVKAAAAFAGMRRRISTWLDDLGVNRALGVESSAELFDDPRAFHATSLIRYPVLVGSSLANYTGSSPRPDASQLLRSITEQLLIPELQATPAALVVPMGKAVARALISLEADCLDRCLIGFPHPSGANGWAKRQFLEHRDQLGDVVDRWASVRQMVSLTSAEA